MTSIAAKVQNSALTQKQYILTARWAQRDLIKRMHIYTLECELITECPLEKTFALFKDPYNLAKITPPSLGFEVISKNRIEMKKGAEIDYRIRWLGLPLHWRTLIEEYEPPHHFVDSQAKGPYASWRHRHTFVESPEGVRIGDHVEYALPFGPLGRVAHAVVVGRQLQSTFIYRQQKLAAMLDGVTTESLHPVIRG